ncbi:universal stress protein [Natronococcus sp.]|uniref:universal stress protein n=1 Tax=Natronococcus sp. TaxID=35747 RepID=UPI003A4DF21B
MPRHVLVPVDGSDRGFAGLEYCLASFPDASPTALFVVDPARDHTATVGSPESTAERAKERGERVLERATERADEHDCDLRTILRTGTPHTEILAVADEEDVDHVVLGSHGRSPITRPFLGRVSEAVVRRSSVSTTVVPETTATIRDRELPGEILVPLDGSEQAEAALAYALETFPDASHTAVHALNLPFDRPRSQVEGTYLEAILEDRERRAEGILESATTLAEGRGATLETETASGAPAREIVEYAESNGYDQLVMGSHGRSLAARLFTGSVAERVARRSPRTVTLVRGAPA